jgi:hypothetical protein
MAEENGNVSDLTIEVLKSIRAELQGLRAETKEGLTEVREGLAEVKEGLAETNAKLEQLAEYTQTGFKALLTQGDRRFLDHEGRLRRLEEHAGIDPTR